jgi:acetyl-CoA synthetase
MPAPGSIAASAIPPPPAFKERARIGSMDEYRALYGRSVEDPAGFWLEMARRIDWTSPPREALRWDFRSAEVEWFLGGKLNASVNCLDRHVAAGHGDRTALIWEGNDPARSRAITYAGLLEDVVRFAGVLRSLGVRKGDRVAIYLPMIPELPVALLACARIGAIHNVVFAGFSADSLRSRIADSRCSLVITADEGVRGPKTIPLKATVDQAIAGLQFVRGVVVVRRTGAQVDMTPGRDLWWHELAVRSDLPDGGPEEMDSNDPLFILYTSGSTGKPKGVLHATGGYLVYASLTHELVFDYRPGEVYWCTADIGWVTGHSYIVYGPLANGATSVMFEGMSSHPDHGRFWDVVDKHRVNIFYTAPTAIRSLMREGTSWIEKHDLSSLRLLGSVGEPINPEAWLWYHRNVGRGRCPIVDTWWQTETGGILIAPLPGAFPLKPGSATLPFPGVRPAIVDDHGQRLEGNGVAGNLCLEFPWPGLMKTVYGDHERFRGYFAQFPGLYFTGDGCRRDEDGYYWITGRVDDVINVAGHRIGTAEVESALVGHPAVAEAAVVGMPHEIKGQGIYAYVTLRLGFAPSKELREELIAHVRREIGAFAAPDRIQFSPGLPKTRSGKILRRILRKIAAGETKDLGDVTTLADPTVIEILLEGR